MASQSNCSTPYRGATSFPFMDLPPETRNEVYKLVLTYPHGVRAHVKKSSGDKPLIDLPPANNGDPNKGSLQYVSKQVYWETRGLAIRYNDVTFSQSSQPKLYNGFNSFASRLPRNHLKLAQRIILADFAGGIVDSEGTLDAKSPHWAEMASLIPTAKALMSEPVYPTIIVRLKWSRKHYVSYIAAMDALCRAFRNTSPFPSPPGPVPGNIALFIEKLGVAPPQEPSFQLDPRLSNHRGERRT